jgi:peptidoglycan/LPS O-acetylase OafA/YrhL
MGEPTLVAEAHTGAPSAAPRVAAATKHVGGLDTVRLVCALAVVFGHIGFVPIFGPVPSGSSLERAARAVYYNAIPGPAAVIVFFVVSGFCIHYPYRDGARIPYLSYYARRYVRILFPMAAAIALGNAVGVKLTLLTDSILWSLVCEEIYYLIYPLLRRLGSRFGFRRVILVSYVLSLGVFLTDPRAGNYPSYGAGLNWLLGLPVWLAGCELAEVVSRPQPVPSRRAIWAWRLGVWGSAFVASVLRFHSPLKYPLTLNLFGFLAALWLVREISYRRAFPAPPVLERGGRWSYSIYLVHLLAVALFGLLGLPDLGRYANWFLLTTFVLVGCYLFARLIEFPSHRFARLVGTRLLAMDGPKAMAATR